MFKSVLRHQLGKNPVYILKANQDYLSGREEYYGTFIIDKNEIYEDCMSKTPQELAHLIASSSGTAYQIYSNVTFRKGNFPDFSLSEEKSVRTFSEISPEEQEIIIKELKKVLKGGKVR